MQEASKHNDEVKEGDKAGAGPDLDSIPSGFAISNHGA